MSKRELISQEISRLSDADLDSLLDFVRTLADHSEASFPALAAESTPAKDWFSAEEEATWGNL